MSEKYILGIDIGTTSLSFVLTDESGNIIEALNKASPPLNEEKTSDPDKIYSLVKSTVDEITSKYNVKSIGFTGQMHGILYVDKNMNALSPLYTWQNKLCDLITESGITYAQQIFNITNTEIFSGYGLGTFYYHTKNALLPSYVYKLVSIMDFVALKLTGSNKPLLHTSVAASFGLFDILNSKFNISAVCKLGLNPEILPDVTGEREIIGYYKNIPVYIPIGDNQASVLSSYCENSVILNYGTGSQMSVITDKYREIKSLETRPFTENRFMLCGAALCGGRAYALLEKFFRAYLKEATGKEECQYETLNRLALLGSGDMDFSTKFAGTRNNPEEKASVNGITENNFTPENFVYSLIKGMVQELYEFYKLTDEKCGKVILTGNGAGKNKALIKAAREIFGGEVLLSEIKEEAAYGAALFAGGTKNEKI
ncbi:MAG: hypothetical protein E7564_09960 [Ruminococcaceae bacterium]|nr:hypothetical protein [Oscillospiraceae bacterium]